MDFADRARLPVPLRPTRQQVLYFQPPAADAPAYGPGFFPVFISMGHDPLDAFYGIPTYDGLGVKVARHGDQDVDPDTSDPVVDAEYQAIVRTFLRGCLPGWPKPPSSVRGLLLYTVAPGERFAWAHSPDGPTCSWPALVAVTASSSPASFVGRVLADLATRGETEVAIDAWSLVPAAAGES